MSPNTDWYNISLIGSSLPWQPKIFNFTSFSSVNATKKLIFGYFDLPRVCAMVVKIVNLAYQFCRLILALINDILTIVL